MKALAFSPEDKRLKTVEREEPRITAEDEIKVRVEMVGICGTDREKAAGGAYQVPEGRADLVIGHEMVGRVVEVGGAVKSLRPGDHAAFTIRRGCGSCVPCSVGRPDMCETGLYRERGLRSIDGFMSEFAVDREANAVRVPELLARAGVFCEPLSVAEKAIDETGRIQSLRLPYGRASLEWFSGRRVLVTGLGPIGLLAALALRLRGAEVTGLDIIDADTPRPQWLKEIGGRYVDARGVGLKDVDDVMGGPADFVYETTGVAGLAFNLPDALAHNGVYVFVGLSGDGSPVSVAGAELMDKLVHGNQIFFGTVNSVRDHFRMAVKDLLDAETTWPGQVERLITHRYGFDRPPDMTEHPVDEIKAVVVCH